MHPLWVAIILADLEMDKETIVSGMLHDVVEDTEVSDEEILNGIWRGSGASGRRRHQAGKAFLFFRQVGGTGRELKEDVPGNGKGYSCHHHQACDRLHNMRTLEFMTPAKQKEKAKETMDIYAPIAQRLGISKIKTELDDLALKYSQPEVFFDLVNQINARKTEREEFVQQIVDEVSTHMKNASIKADVNGASSISSAFTRRWLIRIRRWIRSMTCSRCGLSWTP